MTAGARVLVVEDDPDIRAALVECLALEGYAVASAANGQEGLARMAEGPLPQAVLLDVHMPVLDGVAVLRRLRENPAWAGIPVILASADPAPPSPGSERFLHKPFSLGELTAVLADVLGGA